MVEDTALSLVELLWDFAGQLNVRTLSPLLP